MNPKDPQLSSLRGFRARAVHEKRCKNILGLGRLHKAGQTELAALRSAGAEKELLGRWAFTLQRMDDWLQELQEGFWDEP